MFKSTHYIIIDGEVFRLVISTLLLKCLNDDEAQYVMNEIHKDIYDMHLGGRNMAARVL